MERCKFVDISSTESTNTYAKNLPVDPEDRTPVVVATDNQTAGRGQRGNSWESEPGANITMSLVVYPVWMSAAHQFELSMIVSIAIVETLRHYIDTPQWLKIKWPNDIYFGDRKIAGILIENSVNDGRIERSVIGIGLNVNQTEFSGDVPNPISLIHATGIKIDIHALRAKIVTQILDMLDAYADDPEIDELCALYDSMLWRNDGQYHTWRDTMTGTDFRAILSGVGTDGKLHLTDTDGNTKTYLFKEVSAVL